MSAQLFVFAKTRFLFGGLVGGSAPGEVIGILFSGGEDHRRKPTAGDANGELKVRIACAFPHAQTIVALPEVPVHAYQRAAFVDEVNRQRGEEGKPELSEEEYEAEMERAVDLFVDGQAVLIGGPEFMDLAFEADELLQKDLPKRLIKFSLLSDPRVRDSLKKRGECWRIFLPPTAPNEIRKMIAESRSKISGREIYYYSPVSGTRLLTYDNLEKLGTLNDSELRQHLAEIATYSGCRNGHGCSEVELFMGDHCGRPEPILQSVSAAPGEELRERYDRLCQQIRGACCRSISGMIWMSRRGEIGCSPN